MCPRDVDEWLLHENTFCRFSIDRRSRVSQLDNVRGKSLFENNFNPRHHAECYQFSQEGCILGVITDDGFRLTDFNSRENIHSPIR